MNRDMEVSMSDTERVVGQRWKTSRLLAAFAVVTPLTIATGFGVSLAMRRPALRPLCDQIVSDMSYEEVVAILGEPERTIGSPAGWSRSWWTGRDGTVKVIFVPGRRVDGFIFRNLDEPPGFLDRALFWLGLKRAMN